MTIQALDGTFTVTWPWPQVVFTTQYVLVFALADYGLATGQAASGVDTVVLFELYNSSDTWNAQAWLDLGSASDITSIDIMDFNLFYSVNVLRPDKTVDNYTRNPRTDTLGETHTTLPTSNCPNFVTGCNFNGQAIIGGVVGNTDASWEYANSGTVLWSGIGSFNFRYVEDKTAGSAQVPWGEESHGWVFKVHKLGSVVMVYGDGGRMALVPHSSPVSTYGVQKLSGPGIANPNHWAGDETIHGFISTEHEFILLDSELKETNLGYKEWLEDLDLSITKVSYEPLKRRFFISDGTIGYVFKDGGLYTCNQLVTSVGIYHGRVFCGFFADSGDYEIRITSDTLDFNQRGLKTLEGIEPSADYYSVDSSGDNRTLKVSSKFKTTNQARQTDFRQAAWSVVNNLGIGRVRLQANEFRLQLKADEYRDAFFTIDNIKVRIKLTDYRNIRGFASVN